MKFLLETKRAVGYCLAIAAFLTFLPRVGFAVPMTLEFGAEVTATSLKQLYPVSEWHDGAFREVRIETASVGDRINVSVSLDTNIDIFGTGFALEKTEEFNGPILEFTAFDSLGGFLGGDWAVSSTLEKSGTALTGSMDTGPNVLEFYFKLDVTRGTGILSMGNYGGGYPYDGVLTAAIDYANLSVELGNQKVTGTAVSESTNSLGLLVLGAGAVGVASRFSKQNHSCKKRKLCTL